MRQRRQDRTIGKDVITLRDALLAKIISGQLRVPHP